VRVNGRVVWWWWWLGVLVAGCSQTIVSNPTSPAPTLTLLRFTPQWVTPTPTPRLLRTPTLRTTSVMMMTLAPTPLALPVPAPNCYETPVGGLWCLGLVRNGLIVPIEQVIIRIYLVSADGTALAERDAPTALAVLPPGEMSPYGVLFDRIPEGSTGPVAMLISASKANVPGGNMPVLQVQDLRGENRDSVFYLTGVLVNTGAVTADQLRLVVTLLDSGGRVTGFRQLRWPPNQALLPGEQLSFSLEVIPQGLGTTRFEASAESRVG
jgi:hypothetical protein